VSGGSSKRDIGKAKHWESEDYPLSQKPLKVFLAISWPKSTAEHVLQMFKLSGVVK
jgi:hypothetical protein